MYQPIKFFVISKILNSSQFPHKKKEKIETLFFFRLPGRLQTQFTAKLVTEFLQIWAESKFNSQAHLDARWLKNKKNRTCINQKRKENTRKEAKWKTEMNLRRNCIKFTKNLTKAYMQSTHVDYCIILKCFFNKELKLFEIWALQFMNTSTEWVFFCESSIS